MNDPRMQAALQRIAANATPEYLRLLQSVGHVPTVTPAQPVAPAVVAPVMEDWRGQVGGFRDDMNTYGQQVRAWAQQPTAGTFPTVPRLAPYRPNLRQMGVFDLAGRRR